MFNFYSDDIYHSIHKPGISVRVAILLIFHATLAKMCYTNNQSNNNCYKQSCSLWN